jgi:hypothetical protein
VEQKSSTVGGAATHDPHTDEIHRASPSGETSADLAAMERQAVATIVADPYGYAVLHLRGVAHMLGPDQDVIVQLTQDTTAAARPPTSLGEFISSTVEHHLPPPAPGIVAITSIHLLVLYLLAAVGTVLGWRSRPRRVATITLLLYVAYFLLVSGPEAYPRFRVPIMPFVAILAAVGTRAVWNASPLGPMRSDAAVGALWPQER